MIHIQKWKIYYILILTTIVYTTTLSAGTIVNDKCPIKYIDYTIPTEQKVIENISDQKLTNIINRVYETLLNRKPDPSGFNYWYNILKNRQNKYHTIKHKVIDLYHFYLEVYHSKEFQSHGYNILEQVTVLYKLIFNRKPGSTTLSYWSSYLSNYGIKITLRKMLNTPEAYNIQYNSFIPVFDNAKVLIPERFLTSDLRKLKIGTKKGTTFIFYNSKSDIIVKKIYDNDIQNTKNMKFLMERYIEQSILDYKDMVVTFQYEIPDKNSAGKIIDVINFRIYFSNTIYKKINYKYKEYFVGKNNILVRDHSFYVPIKYVTVNYIFNSINCGDGSFIHDIIYKMDSIKNIIQKYIRTKTFDINVPHYITYQGVHPSLTSVIFNYK